MKEIHYFFNPVKLPADNDDWFAPEYQRIDSARLCAFFRDSWEQQGWTPRQHILEAIPGFDMPGHLKLDPRILSSWLKIRELAPCWIAQIDVLNRFFTFYDAEDLERSMRGGDLKAVNLASNVNLGCFFVTPEFCDELLGWLDRARHGDVKVQSLSLTDETISREHLGHLFHHARSQYGRPYMSFAFSEVDWQLTRLCHYARNFFQFSGEICTR